MAILHAFRVPGLIWQATVAVLPGPSGDRLRYRYWKRRLAHLGAGVRLGEGVHFNHPEHVHIEDGAWLDRNVLVLAGSPRPGRRTHVEPMASFPLQPGQVHIGARTHIAPNCVLSGMGGLSIGARCGIAANTSVFSLVHHYRDVSDPASKVQTLCTPLVADDLQAMRQAPVWIEDDCGIGANSVVLPGTRLKRGTWVGAGSVLPGGEHGPQAVVATAARTLTTSLADLALPQPATPPGP